MIPYFALIGLSLMTACALLWPLRQERGAAISIALLFCLAAVALYSYVGAPAIPGLIDARRTQMKAVKISMEAHAARVKENPKDLEAWVGLGQDFIESGQWEAATNAFKQTVLLSKGHPDLIMAYAKSMILADGGAVSDAAKKSLEMALRLRPENAEARYWLIVRKLQDGRAETAMEEMKALYRSLPHDSPLRKMIDRERGNDQ